jgi:hypothetical protein
MSWARALAAPTGHPHISNRNQTGGRVMNGYAKTAILMAGMTALFLGVGYLLGGGYGGD